MARLRGTHVTSSTPLSDPDPQSPIKGEIWIERTGRRVVITGEARPPWRSVFYLGETQPGRGHSKRACAGLDAFLKRFKKEARA